MSHDSDWEWLSFAGNEPAPLPIESREADTAEAAIAHEVVGTDRLSDYVGEVRPINPKE